MSKPRFAPVVPAAPAAVVSSTVAPVSQSAGSKAQVYYHLYACTDSDCVAAKNPTPYAVHMRGIHLASAVPVSGVFCPGCSKEMKPAEHHADAEAAKAENMHEKFVIYPVNGQEAEEL